MSACSGGETKIKSRIPEDVATLDRASRALSARSLAGPPPRALNPPVSRRGRRCEWPGLVVANGALTRSLGVVSTDTRDREHWLTQSRPPPTAAAAPIVWGRQVGKRPRRKARGRLQRVIAGIHVARCHSRCVALATRRHVITRIDPFKPDRCAANRWRQASSSARRRSRGGS